MVELLLFTQKMQNLIDQNNNNLDVDKHHHVTDSCIPLFSVKNKYVAEDNNGAAAASCKLMWNNNNNNNNDSSAQASSSGVTSLRSQGESYFLFAKELPTTPEELFFNSNNTISPVSPLLSEIMTPPLTTSLLHNNKQEEIKDQLPPSFEYISYLIHLAVFGIIGVLTRYVLQKLFGSNAIGLTSNQSILYADLPSNMIGSFLMGWFGVVFKGKIAHMSDQLAVGISTGYLGSMTTFSGWNQKMLDLSVDGHWAFVVLGFVIGLFLAAYSIIIGIETAKGFRWLMKKSGESWRLSELRASSLSLKSHVVVVTVLMMVWGGLWTTSVILEKKKFKEGGSGAQLWLGCLVSPLGVWLRWWLARLNGCGLGKAARWKWIPFGTLAANVSAACLMAALATLKKAVNTQNCDTIAGGIQLGLMGCLSTVSTFMAEYNAMRESIHPWRAYVYAFITITLSFSLGTLIYSLPVWTFGYNTIN